MLFKLSNLNSNLAVTLGYLNPALNNSAQMCRDFFLKGLVKSIKGAGGGRLGRSREEVGHEVLSLVGRAMFSYT